MTTPASDLFGAILGSVRARRDALGELEAAIVKVQAAFSVPIGLMAADALPALPEATEPRTRRAPKALPAKKARRAAVAPGSIPDRVLDILREAGEPMKLADIVAETKARYSDVKASLADLVTDGRVVRTGATISLRFSLAGPRTAKPSAKTTVVPPAQDIDDLRKAVRKVLATGASYDAFEMTRQMRGVFDTADVKAVTGVLEEFASEREVERIPNGSKVRYRRLHRREASA